MPSKPSPTDVLWDDRQVAAYCGIAPVTARRLRYRGHLPTVKVGAAARVPRSAVLAYVASQTTGGAA